MYRRCFGTYGRRFLDIGKNSYTGARAYNGFGRYNRSFGDIVHCQNPPGPIALYGKMKGMFPMKYCAASLAALVLTLCFSSVSLAHRVNIFAYADGDAIQIECYFSKSQKVSYGKLTFTDLETGATLLEGTTDEKGVFRFQPDAAFLKTGHGVKVVLNAGEGHQSDWQITPEDLRALSPPAQTTKPISAGRPSASAAASQSVKSLPVASPAASQTVESPAINPTELEALIGKVMDAKLVPIKQALARQEDRAPSLKDIIGGIGWILGLLGIATYMRYRR